MTNPTRAELVHRAVPGVAAPFSPTASALNDRLVEALHDCRDLDPTEEARVLSALLLQASGRLATLHGNR